MTITNVSLNSGELIVEGNIKFGVGTVIDQGELLRYNVTIISLLGQSALLGYGGLGLLPTPLDLSLLSVIFSNYTIEANTITEVVGVLTWQLTYNNDGILTVGKLLTGGIETYRLSLIIQSSGGSISFGYGAIIVLSIGIIFLVIKKRKTVKLA